MGRKPGAAKNPSKASMRVEPQAVNGNIELNERVDYQHGNSHPHSSPLKSPNSSVDGVAAQQKSPMSRSKRSKYHASVVRRSERIKSAVVHSSNHDVDCIEEISVSESEKDEPMTQVEEVLPEPELEPEPEQLPEENLSEKSLVEKVDYALQRLEALEKDMELIKSKAGENIGSDESPPLTSISYRSMYIASQKKVEALTEEFRQLTGKLENALGKVEVYEKERHVFLEVLDKMKDAVNAAAISNLTKTTEAAVNISSQALQNACSAAAAAAAAAKRKRSA